MENPRVIQFFNLWIKIILLNMFFQSTTMWIYKKIHIHVYNINYIYWDTSLGHFLQVAEKHKSQVLRWLLQCIFQKIPKSGCSSYNTWMSPLSSTKSEMVHTIGWKQVVISVTCACDPWVSAVWVLSERIVLISQVKKWKLSWIRSNHDQSNSSSCPK